MLVTLRCQRVKVGEDQFAEYGSACTSSLLIVNYMLKLLHCIKICHTLKRGMRLRFPHKNLDNWANLFSEILSLMFIYQIFCDDFGYFFSYLQQ